MEEICCRFGIHVTPIFGIVAHVQHVCATQAPMVHLYLEVYGAIFVVVVPARRLASVRRLPGCLPFRTYAECSSPAVLKEGSFGGKECQPSRVLLGSAKTGDEGGGMPERAR
jgi:hypothetical protein